MSAETPPLPRVEALRLIGAAATLARGRIDAPLGAAFRDDADARALVLGPEDAESVEAVARATPDATDLPPGTLVVVLGPVVAPRSLARSLLAALGRGAVVPRAFRCSALVARGFVGVGAAVDPTTRADLAWGYAPPAVATEPC